MAARQITISTQHASKYLQQMCKHFAHKVDVNYDIEKGFVAFPPGPCTLSAFEGSLNIYCQSTEEEGVKIMETIIETHLIKFAWRETIAFNWEDCPDLGLEKEIKNA